MSKNKNNISLLKILIVLLVFGGLVVGILAQVVSQNVNDDLSHIFELTYLLYESVGRGLIIIFGGLIVLNILRKKKKTELGLRQKSIIGFIISASILLVILPLASGFLEYVSVLMPFPWSTVPLQLLYDGHYFSMNYAHEFGGNGVTILIGTYLSFNIITFLAVALWGRRVFCSGICANFGAHAETLKEGLPLFKTKQNKSLKQSKKFMNTIMILKWTMLAVNLVLIVLWAILLIFDVTIISIDAMRNIELIKYMFLELLLVLYAFSVLSGRFYCMYCPAGSFLALTSRIAGQRINTDKTECISCGLCNKVCDLNIDIMSCAKNKVPVKSFNCVGCGACVDTCPKNTLEYSTKYLSKRKQKSK